MKKHRTLYAMKMELKTLRGLSAHHYRHLHICRCLLKGRRIEEIEPYVKETNQRSEKYLQELLDKWRPILEAEYALEPIYAVRKKVMA